MLVEPICAQVLTSSWAASVISPPYDTMTSQQRDDEMAANPHSFLHVASARAGANDHPSEHLPAAQRGADALNRLVTAGAYSELSEPRLFVQEIISLGLTQRSLLGSVPLAEGQIREHEDTQPGRVHGLAAHFRAVGSMSSPVVVAPSPSAENSAALRAAFDATGEANVVLDATTRDGAQVTVWELDAAEFGGTELSGNLYLSDGHHRVAAAAHAGFRQLLVAVVPAERLQLGSFERRVSELSVMPRRLVEQISEHCTVVAVDSRSEAQPKAAGVLGIKLADRWYRAERREQDSLDAAFVHDVLLPEVFGISDSSDNRLRYRATTAAGTGAQAPGPGGASGGAAGTAAGTEAGADEAPVIIALAPVTVEDVFWVADAGKTMPPKSTNFMPKARSGVLLVPC